MTSALVDAVAVPPESNPTHWRLLRIAVDVIAGGPIAVHLATTDPVELTHPLAEVEVQLTCGLWQRSFPGRVRERNPLAGGEVEWIVEVDGRQPATGATLLPLATLGDVRHLHATLKELDPNPTVSAA